MNWWITALISWIFTGTFGTAAVNVIVNHVAEVQAERVKRQLRIRTEDDKDLMIEWGLTRLGAMMLVSATLAGLGCLIFSTIKVIGG